MTSTPDPTRPELTAALPRLATDPVADPAAVVAGDGYRITVLTDGLLRLEQTPDGVVEDRASTFALRRRQPVPRFRVTRTDGWLQLTTDRLRLTYDQGPFSTSGLSVEVLGGVSSYHSVWRYGLPTEDLGGTARTLDGVDGRLPLEAGVVSRRGFGLIDDSSSALLADDGTFVGRDGSRPDLYLFAYGLDHAQAVGALYAVSGPQPLLPRWALGNWWSRYHRYSADEYLALFDRFTCEGVPFSVAVLDMDWHLVDIDAALGSGWTGYTFDPALFPDPDAFLADLHARGLRVTLNVHPADGVRRHEDAYTEMAAALGRDPGSGEPIAFDVTDPQFLAAYFQVLHRGLERRGVDFWWLDWQSGPYSRVVGIDPLWVLNHLHYLDSARDGRRPLTFSRYAGPGSHRYPVGFSGDTVVSWASLDFQPEFTATAANIGYGWWSHDVGGHMWGIADDELATRWVQLGVVSPILRLHSTENPFMSKEPWRFGPAARAVMVEQLRLRARLVPYLHSMNHRAAERGVPLVVPLYHRHPRSPEAYQHPNQAWFGDALLTAPVTSPVDPASGTAAVTAWLPPGTWTDVFTGVVYAGDREIVLHRDLTRIPVLAVQGTVLPLDGAVVPADDPVTPAHLELVVVVGADGAHQLVEDDGAGEPRVACTLLTWRQGSGTVVVGPACGAVDVLPEVRSWTVRLVGLDPAAGVRVAVDGVPVEADLAPGAPDDLLAPGLRVRVGDVPVTSCLTVQVGPDPTPLPVDVAARVDALLAHAGCENLLKKRVHELMHLGQSTAVTVSRLHALAMPESLRSALDEVLLAAG